MQTVLSEQPIPDLVQSAWHTEFRLKSLERSVSSTMNDFYETRMEVKSIAADLRHVRTEVNALTHEQRRMGVAIQEMKTDISGMKTDIGGLKTEIGGMKTDIGDIKGILRGMLEHFGLTIPKAAEGPFETK